MSKRARGTEHGRGWAALLLLLALSSLLRGFAYTTEDDLIAVTNEAGGKTCFVRDANGAITAETGFDGARRTYKRDKAGRVTEVTLPSKKKTQLSYDAMGRVKKTTYADGTTVEWEYRPDGALAAATNEAGAVTFERDAIGRLLREARGEYHVTSRYAPDGGRETLQSTLGAKAHTFFDPLGEVQALSFGEGTVQSAPTELAIERDAMGNEVRRTLPGGVAIAWERDKAGRPTHRHSLKAQPGFDVLSETEHLAYQWRGNDQLAAILDSDTGPRWYDHDRRGRLVRERGNDWASVRAMDPVGNVYHASDGSDRKFGAGGKLEEDRDGTRYAYDPDGNLVEKVTPHGTWKYAWNGAGQLKEVERPDGLRVAHQYDAFARRTSKREAIAFPKTEPSKSNVKPHSCGTATSSSTSSTASKGSPHGTGSRERLPPSRKSAGGSAGRSRVTTSAPRARCLTTRGNSRGRCSSMCGGWRRTKRVMRRIAHGAGPGNTKTPRRESITIGIGFMTLSGGRIRSRTR